MNKTSYILAILSLCIHSVFSQGTYQKANDAQKKEIINKITEASNEMKTMKCDFNQTKEVTFMDEKVNSEGKMYFKQNNKIRWEYTKPYAYVFSMDGNNVHLSSGNNTNKLPVKSSKLFNEISNIMIGGVSGKGLIDSPDFTTQFGVGKDSYQVILTPLKKEVKELFTSIHLYIYKADNRIHTVEMIEKSGDKTVIQLKNMQINTTIKDEIFSN